MSKKELQQLVTKAAIYDAAYLKERGVEKGTVSLCIELPDGRTFFESLRLESLT